MKAISVIFALGVITLGATSGASAASDVTSTRHLLDFIIEAYKQRHALVRDAAQLMKQNSNTILPVFEEGLKRFQDAESIEVSSETLKNFFGKLLKDKVDPEVVNKVVDFVDKDQNGSVDLQELGAALIRVVRANQGLIKKEISTVLEHFNLDGYLNAAEKFLSQNSDAIKKLVNSIPSLKEIKAIVLKIAEQRGIKIENLKSLLPILRELVQKNGDTVIKVVKSSLQNLPNLNDLVPDILDFVQNYGNVVVKIVRTTLENLLNPKMTLPEVVNAIPYIDIILQQAGNLLASLQ